MTTLKEILLTTKWDDVKKALINRYPGQKQNIEHEDGYKKVYMELLELKPKENTDHMFIYPVKKIVTVKSFMW